MNTTIFVTGFVSFLHNLFTVVWIGGLFVLSATVLPSAKQVLGEGPQTKKLMDTIQKRQRVREYVIIIGLILTGFFQARQSATFLGLLSFGNAYSTLLSLKHILGVIMVAIALYRNEVLGRRQGSSTPAQEKLNARLLRLNAIVGIVILLLSGFIGALAP